MKVEFKTAEYAYKLIVTILAIILPESWMAKASKFLREAERKDLPKKPTRKKTTRKRTAKKRDTS